ncbi:MAG: S8 family serine peptidase [Bacteroidota bacterium]
MLFESRNIEVKAIVRKLQERHPEWNPDAGLCERCLYLNEFDTLDEHFASREHGSLFRSHQRNPFALLPTPLRLGTDPRFTGAGVTIAFIDSGFYPHPDIVRGKNRIRAIVDVTEEHLGRSYFKAPHPESWHGTMTTVAAIGNGNRSRGLYTSIAPNASAVLIKVFDTRTAHVSEENIARGLRWAIENRKRYNIRIISLSVGGDEPSPAADNPADKAAEEAVTAGMVVVAAIGNNPERPIVPPASSPSVITVGGMDDRNDVHEETRAMYHSTFGQTVDGHNKPEIIAPAIWLAGPILPGTDQYDESEALFALMNASRRTVESVFARYEKYLPDPPKGLTKGDYKEWCRERIREKNYVAPFYKHVDGTSFAAPIVSSVIAQMLEAAPALSPETIKQILVETAEPLKNVPADRQGNGVLNPRAAVRRALHRRHASRIPGIHFNQDQIVFIYHANDSARVAIAGSFNGWDATRDICHELDEGIWSCWIRRPSAGTHQYKFVLDEKEWIEDPTNTSREPDGYGGWNSVLEV